MEQTLARYDPIADFYEDFASGAPSGAVDMALLDLAGDMTGLRLLDLACGHGRFARELARRGAAVVGIDLSAALIAKARAAEDAEPLGVTYVHADAASPRMLGGETFDGVVCNFGLSDI